jgi:hypothetical protein
MHADGIRPDDQDVGWRAEVLHVGLCNGSPLINPLSRYAGAVEHARRPKP